MPRLVLGTLAVVLGVAAGYLTRSTVATSAPQRSAGAERVVSSAARRVEPPPPAPRELASVVTLEQLPVAAPAAVAPPPATAGKAAMPTRARLPRSPGPRPPAPSLPSVPSVITEPAESPASRPPAEPPVTFLPSAPSLPARAEAVAPEPADIPVTRAVMDRGRQMLSGDEGRLPTIVAHYRDTLGFQGYARAVRSFGGRFFVRDVDARVLRAEIDVSGGRLLPVDRSGLAALSPLSRDLSDEPALRRFTLEAKRTYGPARYIVLLLLPAPVDAAVLGALDAALRAAARAPQEFVVVEGEYRQRGGDLVLEFASARSRSGELLAVRATVNLSRIP